MQSCIATPVVHVYAHNTKPDDKGQATGADETHPTCPYVAVSNGQQLNSNQCTLHTATLVHAGQCA